MSNAHWTMKVVTDSRSHELDFSITDNHHKENFYGAWHAKSKSEMHYHLDGLEKCIHRGTFRKNEFVFDGSVLESWPEFQQKMLDYFEFYDSEALFDIA